MSELCESLLWNQQAGSEARNYFEKVLKRSPLNSTVSKKFIILRILQHAAYISVLKHELILKSLTPSLFCLNRARVTDQKALLARKTSAIIKPIIETVSSAQPYHPERTRVEQITNLFGMKRQHIAKCISYLLSTASFHTKKRQT